MFFPSYRVFEWKLKMAHGGSWKTKRIGAGFIFTNSHVTSRSHKITHHITSRHLTSRHVTSHHIIYIYICIYIQLNELTNFRWFRHGLRPINIAGAYTIYKWELNSCNEGNKNFGNPTTLTMLLSHGSPHPNTTALIMIELSHGSPHPNTTALIMIEYASSQICLNRKPFTFLRIDIFHKCSKSMSVQTSVMSVQCLSMFEGNMSGLHRLLICKSICQERFQYVGSHSVNM